MGRRGLVDVVLGLATAWLALSAGCFINVVSSHEFNYRDALGKSILFLEAQRSGKLPRNNRVPWRGDSGLDDGKLAGVDLVGGYYDAGDNIKYGFPMAFTVTTLAWGAVLYRQEMQSAGEMHNVLNALRWGTDYFLKCSSKRNKLWVHVGDAKGDHECWLPPENMRSTRIVKKIDESTPGTEIAAETAAAMAASSIVFRRFDRKYARRLLNKAKWLFQFAKEHKASFDGECPQYCSNSGYNDELLWAATWLYIATRRPVYHKFITQEAISNPVNEWGWDLKYAGVHILLTKLYLAGEPEFGIYKPQADSYVCSVLPQSPYRQIYISPGGFIHMRDGANTQYALGAASLLSIYSEVLERHQATVKCGKAIFKSSHLMNFAKQQMDYVLGKNPQNRSYMVGFGKNPPTRPHHRGASVPKLAKNNNVHCGMSFTNWLWSKSPNPHVLTGAIVGGPDRYDNFEDLRWDSSKLEPCSYINSQAVGLLAKLAGRSVRSF